MHPLRLLYLLTFCTLGACMAPVHIRHVPEPLHPVPYSTGTDALLDAAGLRERAADDPDGALSAWLALPSAQRNGCGLVTAELAARAAIATEPRPQALGMWLICARETQPFLADADEETRTAATQLWHTAVRRTAAFWEREGFPAELTVNSRAGRFELVREMHRADVHTGRFESLKPAAEIRQHGLDRRITRAGIGVPFVAARANHGTSPLDRHLPVEGIWWPATGVLDCAPEKNGRCRVSFQLCDPGICDTVVLSGRRHMLAADFTAPLAVLLSRCREMRVLEYKNAFRPGDSPRPPALLMTEPFRRDRIPLILVHGLLDSPITWRQMVNELRAVPEISRHYQIWQFHYPTGVPPLLAGTWLREELEHLRRAADPALTSRAANEMVVAGHSMGGLIARTLVCDSGDQIWRSIASAPIDGLQGTAETLTHLRSMHYFKPLPYVKRAVFLAVPHRGAKLAGGPLGAIGRLLIRPPQLAVTMLESALTLNPGVFQFTADDLSHGLTTSVADLAPESPTTCVLGCLPVSVPHHSIIGQWLPGPKETGSDAVVPWTSCHLESAGSEKIVRHTHKLCNDGETIAEMTRILLEHVHPSAPDAAP